MKNFLCIYFFHRAHSCSYLGHFLGRIITASYDKAVKAWDLETGKLLVSVARPGDLDWAWEGLLWGWRLGWDGKPVFQKRRILSGIPGDGGGSALGKESFLGQAEEGFCWKDGKRLNTQGEGVRENGAWHSRLRGLCRKSLSPMGLLGFDGARRRAESMGQRPRAEYTSVLGSLDGPPSIHPNQPETPSLSVRCPCSPGPAKGAAQGARHLPFAPLFFSVQRST